MTNVALVVLDTLRKDYFDEYFDWLPGVRFDNAWSTSHWTVPAHASLFTGKYPSETGTYMGAEALDCDGPVLAERLAAAGYTTRAFSANVNVSQQFGYDRGFDEFEGTWRLEALARRDSDVDVFDWEAFVVDTQDEGPTRYAKALWRCLVNDCDTVPSLERGLRMKLRDLGFGPGTNDAGAKEALEFLRETEFADREFLFVNLMETHLPYDPPEQYQSVTPPELQAFQASFRGPEADPDHVERAYRDCVRYLTDVYRELFEELRTSFDLVVTLSDHGELLGEHGRWGHFHGIPPVLTQVPLSIHGGDDGGHRRESVSLLDVHRTVLEAADVTADGSRGRNLLGPVDDGEFLTEYHGLSDRYFEVLEDNGITDYGHLDGSLDGIVSGTEYGYEDFDGFVGPEPLRERLRELVDGVDRMDAERTEVDPETRELLRDLGYA